MAMEQILHYYESFKSIASPPLSSYLQYLPVPKNINLASLERHNYPQIKDMWNGVLIAVLLTILRAFLSYFVFEPLGRFLMKQRYYRSITTRSPQVDAFLTKTKLPLIHEKQRIAKEASMTVKQLDQYIRRHRNAEREAKRLHKFVEVLWKFLYHVFVTIYGLVYIIHQPYAKNLDLCWQGYPFITISPIVYWYYMSELGIYIHECIYHFFEARRSDFVEMLIHHIATLLLITGSYTCNYLTIGSLVMVVHDSADCLLEMAKLFNYISVARPWAQKWSDNLFIAFAIAFGATRNIIYPFWLLRNTFYVSYKILPKEAHRSMTYLNVFLGVLLCLHIFWVSLIIKMAVKMAATGKTEKDARSDDESYIETSIVTRGRSGSLPIDSDEHED